MLSAKLPPKTMKPIFHVMIFTVLTFLIYTVPTPSSGHKTTARGVPLTSTQTKQIPKSKPHQTKITSRNEPEVKLYNIPLDKETQEYTIRICNEYDVSPELIFAIMKVESNFDKHEVTENTNGSIDSGIMQLNSNYFKSKNTKHNIKLAVQHVKYLHDFWIAKGNSEEFTYKLVIQSYHSGINGARRIFRYYGFNYETKYYKSVNEYKSKLEND